MKFFASILALASAAVVYAQMPNSFNIPPEGLSTSAGSSLNLSWTPTTPGTVSLYLRSGNSAFLNSSGTIATGIPNNGQYTWSVPSDIVRGSSYAVEIVSDSDKSAVNYTPQFVIDSSVLTASTSQGASATGSTTSGSASATGSTTAASTTSTGSETSSATVTSSGASRSSSASNTGSTTSSRSSAASAGIQTASTTGGANPRATVMAGMLGAVALGALAL